MDRWVEKPQDDYLQFLPVWIRLRNLPVNYYTEKSIKEIAQCVGKVLEVVFDTEKAQVQDYVRVRVLLPVANPMRNSKEVQLPTGELVLISFDYERIRKRCFQCQRLTHDKNHCSFKSSSSIKAISRNLLDQGKRVEINLQDLGQEKLDTAMLKEQGVLVSAFKDPKTSVKDLWKPSIHPCLPLIANTQTDDFCTEMPDLDIITGFSKGYDEASSSGSSKKNLSRKKTPASWSRQGKSRQDLPLKEKIIQEEEIGRFDKVFKRKAVVASTTEPKCIKREKTTVVPGEPSLDQ